MGHASFLEVLGEAGGASGYGSKGLSKGYGSIGWKVKVAQSCPTLFNPTDYTVHGIL